MRIGYAKLGRSILLDPHKWGVVGGDNEPLELLTRLALRHPEHEFVVAGRHSGDPGNLPRNVVVPNLDDYKPQGDNAVRDYIASLYDDLDHAIIHLGQHGTSNMPIPQDKDKTKNTNPQEWSLRYAGPILRGVNKKQSEQLDWEPIWLVQDPRNYLKARDLKFYPMLPILGQYEFERVQTHWRFMDPRTPLDCARAELSEAVGDGTWKSKHSYVYSGLELAGVPQWETETRWPSWDERSRFGVLMNENREYVKHNRLDIAKQWVIPLEPAFWHGKWKAESQGALGREIESVSYDRVPDVLASTRATITTPASGSQWATAKPWECFAVGTICFFHPLYDTQGHIIPTLDEAPALFKSGNEELANLVWWLRPRDPSELADRVREISLSEGTYNWLRQAQWNVLAKAREENLIMRHIDSRLT